MSRRPAIGQTAPDFELATLGAGGDTWSLGTHLGGPPVVLIFHRHIH